MSQNENLDDEVEKLKLRKIQELLRQADSKKPANNENVKPQLITLTDQNFEQEIRKNRAMVVDFWAPWCGPCRIVSPIIEQLAAQYAGKLGFGKLNVDDNPYTAQAYGIQGIPTIMFFKYGEPVDMIVGAAPKSYIASKINQLLDQVA
ncbi:MAG: thioredoxin [Thermoprotei archaeon]